jgi:pheromone a factor receptor
VGCYPAIVNTSLTYFLVTLWPIFIGIAALVFTAMNLSYARNHRHSLDSWLECTPSQLLTFSLYRRLVILGFSAFVLSFWLSVQDLASQITAGSVTWPGWAVVHADFGRVDQIPRGIWGAGGKDSGLAVELRRWVSVWCALSAFALLGTTREAGERYRAFGRMILRAVGGKSGQRGDGSDDIKM